VTSEKLKEFRDFCYAKGMLFGGGSVTLGSGIGISISTGVPHVDLFAVSALFFATLYFIEFFDDGEFERIEREIENVGGENRE